MIGDGKLLTNAHCVEHDTQVLTYVYQFQVSILQRYFIFLLCAYIWISICLVWYILAVQHSPSRSRCHIFLYMVALLLQLQLLLQQSEPNMAIVFPNVDFRQNIQLSVNL